MSATNAERLVVKGALGPRFDEILTSEALAFVAELHGRFDAKRRALLEFRNERQVFFDNGGLPDFLPETKAIREGDWKVAPIPADLLDRRVEITGPVDRKMIVNALNSGAKVFMADFEDASSPVWANMVEGQLNLKDRWANQIDFNDPRNGKDYKLGANPAVLIIRPRGWHLPERHITFDGMAASGSLVDFGLYVFHNAKAIVGAGFGRLFLPAEDREPSRSAPLERRLHLCRGSAWPDTRHHQGDRADRDAAGSVRDGRDHL
jgi:malate synthase